MADHISVNHFIETEVIMDVQELTQLLARAIVAQARRQADQPNAVQVLVHRTAMHQQIPPLRGIPMRMNNTPCVAPGQPNSSPNKKTTDDHAWQAGVGGAADLTPDEGVEPCN